MRKSPRRMQKRLHFRRGSIPKEIQMMSHQPSFSAGILVTVAVQFWRKVNYYLVKKYQRLLQITLY